ncbi:MAG: hypothetical protein DMF56_16040 [Acidobacteria bacterium]|nr:MAG: hypothetical protein DMF56_16040 [Acidobacteriota bacterium]
MRERVREAIVPSAYGLVALLTFRQYGITFDESVQALYGELTLRYFTGHGAYTFGDLRFYGPLFETIAAIAYAPFPAWKFDIRHLLIATTAVVTLIATGRLAKRADVDPLIAQLALVMMPQWWGHSFNNSKDVPFACACVVVVLAFVRMADADGRWQMADGKSDGGSAIRHPPSAIGRAGVAGVALGAALAIRPGGALFFGLTAIALIPLLKWRIAIAGIVGWIVMVALWPWAHLNPILNPIRAIREAASFSAVMPVLFEGDFVRSNLLPRRYLAEMLAITIPLPILILGILGIIIALHPPLQRPRVLIAAWLIVPVVLFTIWRPNVYDGVRHFLFLMPFLALSVAMAAKEITRRWPRRHPEPAQRGEGSLDAQHPAISRSFAVFAAQDDGGVAQLAIVAVLALSIIPIIRLHPYQMTYYNELVGGTRGAALRFETDYWLSSYREAAMWLRAHACPNRPTRVLAAATQSSIACLRYYLPRDRFTVTQIGQVGLRGALPPQYDYYVGTTRWSCAANYDATPVVQFIGRDGAVFTVIRSSGCR